MQIHRAAAEGHLETIASLHARADERVGHHQRLIERIAAQVGRPRTLYTMLVAVLVWIAANLAMTKPLDPAPFFGLQGLLGLYAAVVTTIVLTAQNRQQRESQHKSYLELQVNLSAEQKTAKIIELLEELRRDLPDVVNRRDTQAEVMSQAVDAHGVMTALEQTLAPRETEPPPSLGDEV